MKSSKIFNKIAAVTNLIGVKFFFLMGVLLILSFGIIAYINTYFLTSLFQEDVVNNAVQISNIIKRATYNSMLENRRNDLTNAILSIGKEEIFEGIRIYNKKGIISFSDKLEEVGQVADKKAEQCYVCHAEEPAKGVIPTKDRTRTLKSPEGYRILGLINTIENEPECFNASCHAHPPREKLLGLLDVKVSLEKGDRKIIVTRNKMIIYSAILILVAALVKGCFIRKMIHNPIKKLTSATREIANLNLDHKVEINSRDEIGELGGAFNKMVKNLKETTTTIENLEQEMSERREIEEKLQESERKIRAILDQTFQFIGLMTTEGILIEVNKSALDAVGIEANNVLGKPFWETPWWTHSPELQEKIRQAVKNVVRGELVRFEATYLVKDGTLHYMDFSLKPIKDESGNVIFMIPEGRDITERKQIEERLLLAHVELEVRVAERTDALRDLREANVKLSDRNKDIEKRNREIELMGHMGNLMQSCQSLDEGYNILVQTMIQLFPNDSGALFIFRSSRNLLEAAAVWGKTQPKEMSFIPDDCWAIRQGRDYCIADVATGLKCRHVEDAVEAYLCVPMITHGEVQGSFYFMRGSGDMTQSAEKWLEENQLIVHSMTEQIGLALGNIKLQETLRHLAIHDPLTALYNRRFMEESFDREFMRSKRKNIPIGIIMLDIDHFKRLNDTFGHEAGDAVLRELGALLQKNVRGSDIACRYGGEEFVIILPEASLEVTLERAEHIREQVKHLNVILAGKPLEPINISAGVAVFPDQGETYEIVLHAADIALYQAKKSGRDRVCVAE